MISTLGARLESSTGAVKAGLVMAVAPAGPVVGLSCLEGCLCGVHTDCTAGAAVQERCAMVRPLAQKSAILQWDSLIQHEFVDICACNCDMASTCTKVLLQSALGHKDGLLFCLKLYGRWRCM